MSIHKQFIRSIGHLLSGSEPSEVSGAHSARPRYSPVVENKVLRETNLELLETLGAVVDSLSPFTLYHSIQVAIYALELARMMDMPVEEQEQIFMAGLVHDVGMISLSSAAISKENKFTDEENQDLRLHPTIGGEIVGRIHHLKELAPLIHYHHERFDGEGYPDRLNGEEIPIGARVLALADSLDALLTDRPNREGMDLPSVVAEVRRCAGNQFDPRVVRAFIKLVKEKPPSFFDSSNNYAKEDMLLSTVGIGSGRAKALLKKQ